MKRAIAATTALVVITLVLSACAPTTTRQDDAADSSSSETGATASDPGTGPEVRPSRDEDDAAGHDAGQTEAAPEQATPPEPDPTPVEREAPAPEVPATPEPEPKREAPGGPEPPEAGLSLGGRIALSGGEADVGEAIVYFVPESGTLPKAASVSTKDIVTRDKTLAPTVMTVSSGSEIRFPNEDPILHNLFSVSSGNDFDVGVYGPSEVPTVTLEQPGVVNIYCNVHHDMHAHVLVLDTPWRTRAGPDGRFRLEDLPTGRGELHVWHRQSEPWSRSVELPGASPLDITLNISKPSLPQHRDKTGQPYNRRNRDPYQ